MSHVLKVLREPCEPHTILSHDVRVRDDTAMPARLPLEADNFGDVVMELALHSCLIRSFLWVFNLAVVSNVIRLSP